MKIIHAISLLLLLVGCDQSPSLQVTGGAGREIPDPQSQIIQTHYLIVIEYAIKNTAWSDVVFNRVEERWSIQGGGGGGISRTIILPQGKPWTLKVGQSKKFISSTKDYTDQLESEAHGRPVEFSFTLYRDDAIVFGPIKTVLPDLQGLPKCDQDTLFMRNSDNPSLKEFLSNLPEQKLQPLTFSKSGESSLDSAEALRKRYMPKEYQVDLEDAAAMLNKELGLQSDSPEAYFHRGMAKNFMRNFAGAIEDFSKSIEHNPNYADAYFHRGVARKNIGDLDGAIADFTETIRLKPNGEIVNLGNAYSMRGLSKGMKGDLTGYNEDIEIAEKLNKTR